MAPTLVRSMRATTPLLLLLLLLAALALLCSCTPSARPLHRPVIDAAAVHATGEDDAHIVFVETQSHLQADAEAEAEVDDAVDVDLEADAEAEAEADAESESESEAEVDTEVDADADSEPVDPAGHSPFRVRSASIEGATESELESAARHSQDGLGRHHTSLLEGSPAPTPASHSVDIPLTRSVARSATLDRVLLEVRSRQEMSSSDHESFLQLSSEGRTQEEAERAWSSNEELSMLEVRSRDVPLYQEVLAEKHLATYYGTLRVGETLFRVLFDTGSCELWIPSDSCTTARCMRHKRYPASKHPPRYFGKTRMNIAYISGKVSGPMIVSKVQVGDLTVPNQILGLAHTLDIELLDDVSFDGIVGLAYPSRALVTKGVTPLFDNIIRQKLLSNPAKGLANQFAYYIDDSRGMMTWGGVNCAFVVRESQQLDPTKDSAAYAAAIESCKRSFQFAPVTRKTYWTLTLEDVSLEYPPGVSPPQGQKLKGHCGAHGCRAMVDTGTYLTYTSKFFQTPTAWSSFSHCRDTANLPNITFHVRQEPHKSGGRTLPLTLQPRDYVLKFDKPQGADKSREDCIVGISPDKDAVFTLGQVFLRAYYTIFDRDENRIGFTRIHRRGHAAVNAKPAPTPPHGA